MPLVLLVLFAMAWWTIRSGKPSGRGWAIAASIAILVQILPVIAVTVYALIYAAPSQSIGFIIFDSIGSAIGILGLIAFGPRNAVTQAPAESASLPRITGDGTSRILDTIAWMLQIAGYWFGMGWWYRWSRAEGLHRVPEMVFWFQLLGAILLATAVHELGHAGVGIALGMKLRTFLVGPFQWAIRDGRWKFNFIPSKILCAGGAAGVVPADPNQSRWNEICMIAAGPVVNLYVGVIAMCCAFTAKGQSYEEYWQFFALFATICLVMFAGNLIPFRPEASYSDGARIYQLLRGGPLADLQRAFNLASSTHVTAVRPRDYDIHAIRRAQAKFTVGNQALLLRLIAAEHFLDKGAMNEFCEHMAAGEAIFAGSALNAPADWLTIFVFGNALLRRDAARAQQWWAHVEAAKDMETGVNYWLAKSALLWAGGNRKEAFEACGKGEAAAKNPARCGSDQFDLYRLNLLRDTIAAPLFAEEVAS